MSDPFHIDLFAGWPDMDFNQHMRNAAYLGAAENCRMRFLSEHGFTMATFRERGLGPVLVEDRLTYRKEIGLLEPYRVDIALSASTRDARKIRVRNTVRRADGDVAAGVESVILWFDLRARKTIVPPDDLAKIWLELARTDDFTWFD